MSSKLTIFSGLFAAIFMLFGIFSSTVEIRAKAIVLTTLFAMLFFYSAEKYVRKSISQQVEFALKKDHKVI